MGFRPHVMMLATLAALVACTATPPPPRRIVLVVIDTLRADRLGAYGSTRGLTPYLDALAERAVVFRNAWSTAPYTRPAVASLFTSRFPSAHGVTDFTGLALAESEVTLAEVLSGRGWRTGAVLGTPVPDRRSGFAQGFDTYDEPKQSKRNGTLLRVMTFAALPALIAQDTSFLYLHYMDPHPPWAPPSQLLARTDPGSPAPDPVQLTRAMMVANLVPPDAPTRAAMEAVYDAEVAAVDLELRALFEFLGKQRFLESTVVVITADHGEGFGAHGHFGHANTLYEELIRVPLLMVLPGQSTGRVVDEPVSLIDVAPTLLDLAGIEAPASFEGRSLRPLFEAGLVDRLAARFSPGAPVISELPNLPTQAKAGVRPRHTLAIRQGNRKVVRAFDGTHEAFDLAHDPIEQRPDPTGEDRLTTALDEFVARHAAVPAAPKRAVDPETASRLQALGYVTD